MNKIYFDFFNRVAVISNQDLENFPELKVEIEKNLGECNFLPLSTCGGYGNCQSHIFFYLQNAPLDINDDNTVLQLLKSGGIDASLLSIQVEDYYEIYNVCVKEKARGKGIVNNLFYAMFDFYYRTQNGMQNYWLQIDFNNPMFSSVLKVYARLGFRNVAISNRNSKGKIFASNNFLTLRRITGQEVNPMDTIHWGNKFRSIYHQSTNPIRQEYVYLKTSLLDFLYKTVREVSVEIGGGLFVVDLYNETPVLDIVQEEMNVGSDNAVNLANPSNNRINRFVFHTHHFQFYCNYDAFFASPSSQDILLLPYNNPEILCSLVFTMEGIYMTTKNPNFLIPNLDCAQKLHQLIFNFTQPLEWARKKKQGEVYTEEKINEACDNFIQKMNELTLRKLLILYKVQNFDTCLEDYPAMLDIPLFNFTFIPWAKAKEYLDTHPREPGIKLRFDSRLDPIDGFQFAGNTEIDHPMDLS